VELVSAFKVVLDKRAEASISESEKCFRTYVPHYVPHYGAASLPVVTSRVKVPTMGDFPFAHLA
jgi:hypothetical protein